MHPSMCIGVLLLALIYGGLSLEALGRLAIAICLLYDAGMEHFCRLLAVSSTHAQMNSSLLLRFTEFVNPLMHIGPQCVLN